MRIVLCLIVLCVSFIHTFAQANIPNEFKKFSDYYDITSSPDSVDKIVYSHANDFKSYAHELIWLEMSRIKRSYKFGKDLETIKKLSAQQHSKLGTAMYYYLHSIKERENETVTLASLQKAYDYFEVSKDTFGVAMCHFQLMRININNFGESKGHFEKAKEHYLSMVALKKGNIVSKENLMLQLFTLFFHDIFFKPKSMLETEKSFLKIYKDVEGLPNNNFFLADWHNYFGYFLAKNSQYIRAIKHFKMALKYNSYDRITLLNNIATGYYFLNQWQNAEKYYIEAINSTNLQPDFDRKTLIEMYRPLIKIKIFTKKYNEIIRLYEIEDSLSQSYNKALSTREVLNLQVKYETEKKESQIKALQYTEKLEKNKRAILTYSLMGVICLIGLIVFFYAKLREANKELLILQKNRDKLYTIIAHDLRSPLNTFQHYSEIINHLVISKQFDKLVLVGKQIDELGIRLSIFLNNLLKWSLNKQKLINIEPVQIHIEGFFNENLPMFHQMANLKSIHLGVNVKSKNLFTDLDVFSLIVRNLLDNAIKYTPTGKTVSIKCYDKVNEFVLEISNETEKLSTNHIHAIERLFEDPNEEFDFGGKGLGVGLIMCKEFINKIGAKVQFSYELSGLIIFKVLIPQKEKIHTNNYGWPSVVNSLLKP